MENEKKKEKDKLFLSYIVCLKYDHSVLDYIVLCTNLISI